MARVQRQWRKHNTLHFLVSVDHSLVVYFISLIQIKAKLRCWFLTTSLSISSSNLLPAFDSENILSLVGKCSVTRFERCAAVWVVPASENWMLKYPTSLALQMLTVTVEIVFHDSYLNRAKPSERPEGIRKGMEFKKH